MSQTSNKSPLDQAPIQEGFFLKRPVFSAVISIFMILLGVLAIGKLPISQYPELTPPSVQVAAQAGLPDIVRQYGVTVKKQSSSFLLVASLSSDGGVYDDTYLSNYALFYIMDGLKRIPGVGNAEIMGSKDYAIRVWLNPQRMAQLGLTTAEIGQAVKDQNNQYSFGSVGAMPSSDEIQMTWQVSGLGRLTTPEEFGNIILRTTPDGGVLRLKDVARVELGAKDYSAQGRTDGKLAVPIAVYLGTGANALDTAQRVEAYFEEVSKAFPTGIEYSIPYNTTTFVKISIEEVIHTLVEAMFLVFVVVYLFLQKWEATLIPCIAVPISLVGTFAGIYALGFSINTLTLFALVLAIGIVVDDAIVVMENMARILETEDLTPRQATAKAMHEVTGAVIAIVLVLCAVFIPVGFMGGLAGVMYRQFAITIAISVTLSGIVALTLTPTLCVMHLNISPTALRTACASSSGAASLPSLWLPPCARPHGTSSAASPPRWCPRKTRAPFWSWA